MSRRCEITGKRGLNGNRVSHANNKTHHVQKPNLQRRRIWVAELGRYVRVRLSRHGLRVLERRGGWRALREAGLIPAKTRPQNTTRVEQPSSTEQPPVVEPLPVVEQA